MGSIVDVDLSISGGWLEATTSSPGSPTSI